jgi:hypothetical protein
LASVANRFENVRPELEDAGWEDGFGISVRFTSFPDVQLAIDSLEQKSQGIELLNVHSVGDLTIASVWIPEGRLQVFERKIADYLAEKRDKNGRSRDNQKFLDAIRDIRTAVIEDLWLDQSELPAATEVTRFEAWLSTPRGDEPGTRRRGKGRTETPETRIARFRRIAEQAGMQVSAVALRFPERSVLQLLGTVAQLRASAHLLGQLAELRRAPETSEFFMRLLPEEQRQWAQELLARAQFPPRDDMIPHVCVLDTGCAQGHPLILPALDAADMHTVDINWPTTDEHGHGTEQAGLALWGDLTDHLASDGPVVINHRLESVKLLTRDGANLNEHLGPLTAQAVSLPEITAPFRRRLFSMALTSTETTLRGRPTAWSAEVDALTSDWGGNGDAPRLMLVSAGNVAGLQPGEYPALNSTTSVEDPAQAWNALTVGALTHKTQIVEADTQAYTPVASSGQLSPYSSTSRVWRHDTPFKPDVVFEGGNQGEDGLLVSSFDSLSLLTTHYQPVQRYFTTGYATSAATSLAARFAAQVMAKYPNLWPETIRALVVHSADWTPELLTQFPGDTAEQVVNRLRHCGWGEPNLDRALHSGADSLTLLVQDTLQPFQRKPKERDDEGKVRGGNITARDLRLHKLPWPRTALQELFAQDVELRVTLSYYIEPNPGERGQSNRFSYASHGLRFAVQKREETEAAFQRRINQLARDSEDGIPVTSGGDPDWLLGFRQRFRGSLHHDRLHCAAVDLASRAHIAVFPVGGWWKTREAQQRFDRQARYSLVVSVNAPDVPTEIDLYTEVEQTLRVAIPIEVTAGR